MYVVDADPEPMLNEAAGLLLPSATPVASTGSLLGGCPGDDRHYCLGEQRAAIPMELWRVANMASCLPVNFVSSDAMPMFKENSDRGRCA